MVDSELVALLRAVIDKFPDNATKTETAARSRVVSKTAEVAGKDDTTIELTQARGVLPAPTERP
jgi:hypothetical protein